MRADLLLHNGRIHPMTGAGPVSSLAVWGGRIVAVDEDVDARRRVDLAGRTVTPGWHDAHNHMAMFGIMLGEIDLSYDAVRDLDQLYAAIAAADRAAACRAGAASWSRTSTASRCEPPHRSQS